MNTETRRLADFIAPMAGLALILGGIFAPQTMAVVTITYFIVSIGLILIDRKVSCSE